MTINMSTRQLLTLVLIATVMGMAIYGISHP